MDVKQVCTASYPIQISLQPELGYTSVLDIIHNLKQEGFNCDDFRIEMRAIAKNSEVALPTVRRTILIDYRRLKGKMVV
jgi:hypothetical protein